MKNNEHSFNYALGQVLQNQRHEWLNCVETEMNGSIVGGGRADNLIYPDAMQPVVVESAFANTPNIDSDAIARLGRLDGKNQREIMTAVALSIPESVRDIRGDVDGIKKWLESGGELNYAIYSTVANGVEGAPPYDIRYPDGKPNSGYIRGTAADLAILIELAATPDKRIKQVAQAAGGAVRGIGAMMYDALPPPLRKKIAHKVGQPPDVHAMRVAACVWLNALALHSKLAAALSGDIVAPHNCQGWRQTTEAWKSILKIDYNSVFRPALESLELLSVHGDLAENVLSQLRRQVENINALHLGSVADVSSDMFPELATDRKTTAAFYTLPEVAELLAGLAFNLIPPGDSDLKIADFACGTGALLKAAYRQVRRRATLKIDMSALHSRYMEECLHGADIQPIAAHLTVAGLAGMNPSASYRHSNVICADVRGGKTGSLDLLKKESLKDLFGTGSLAGVDKSSAEEFHPQHDSFDLCIMNPPYSRNRGKRKLFDVQGLKESDRKKSIGNLRTLMEKSFANMKAGMATAFCLLSDRKLKNGGVLATVLPLTAAGQSSWRKFRAHVINNYSEVTVVGLVPGSGKSFSADTGMEEMLVCGRKSVSGKKSMLTVINLYQLPRDFIEAHEMARAMRDINKSGELRIGGHVFGNCIKLYPQQDWHAWGGVGVKNHEIATVSESMSGGILIKPGLVNEVKIKIPMKMLSQHLKIGPSHDEIGHPPGGDGRGAFAFRKIRRGDKSNLSLWAADCKTQARMTCAPTHRGQLVMKERKLAKRMLERCSTLFISRNLRMTSQKPAAAMTDMPCMGGRAWAALLPSDESLCAAYCLWFNSTLGLLVRWQCGGKQHPGRAQMQLGGIGEMPCPDFSIKSPAAKLAVDIANLEFHVLAGAELLPCSWAWRDENRKAIDRIVLRMLGIDEQVSEADMKITREEWCCEPSVHGGNKLILKSLYADELIGKCV